MLDGRRRRSFMPNQEKIPIAAIRFRLSIFLLQLNHFEDFSDRVDDNIGLIRRNLFFEYIGNGGGQ